MNQRLYDGAARVRQRRNEIPARLISALWHMHRVLLSGQWLRRKKRPLATVFPSKVTIRVARLPAPRFPSGTPASAQA